MPRSLSEIDPIADERWDRYVSAHPEGLVYHHSAWLKSLRREYGQCPTGLALIDDAGEVSGVLPLILTRGLPFARSNPVTRRRLSSLPRTPVGGPLADDAAGLAALASAAVDRTPPGTQLQIKVADRRLDGLVAGLDGHPWRKSYALELPGRPEDVRFGNSRNHSRIRWAVNKARKEGVTVTPAEEPEELRRWYRLYLDTMRHHAVPARPLRLFEALWEELRPRGMMRLLLARRDGELLAGSVLLMHGSTVFYAFNGVLRTAFRHRPNDILQWEAIHRAAADGFRWYDFGEVADRHDGLADFKSKWNAQASMLQRYYHPPLDARPGNGNGNGNGSRGTERAVRVWRRVPLRLTALGGETVYRFL
jgi:hypothetical protein